MIPYERFYDLRLNQFIKETDIAYLTDWEFEDRIWIGEASGFSEWLRLEDDQEKLRSLSINFEDFPVVDEVLNTLGLPLRPGLSADEVGKLLGEPVSSNTWPRGRVSSSYRWPAEHPYMIDCTYTNDEGLLYLVVMVP